MKLEKSQVVYVIYNPLLQYTKIGISENPQIRKRTLETACGCELELFYYTDHFVNASEIELSCHLYHKNSRLLGEWFKCGKEEAQATVIKMANKGHKDKIIEAYKEGKSISSIADKMGVTRQAIINKLVVCGLHGKEPADKYTTRVANYVVNNTGSKIEDSVYYLDDEKPSVIGLSSTTNPKRIEPNIKEDKQGWLHVSVYMNGKFNTAYTRDIEKARQFRDKILNPNVILK